MPRSLKYFTNRIGKKVIAKYSQTCLGWIVIINWHVADLLYERNLLGAKGLMFEDYKPKKHAHLIECDFDFILRNPQFL